MEPRAEGHLKGGVRAGALQGPHWPPQHPFWPRGTSSFYSSCPISSSCCHFAWRAMSYVPVALGSVDPEQQFLGEGGRREPDSVLSLFRAL